MTGIMAGAVRSAVMNGGIMNGGIMGEGAGGARVSFDWLKSSPSIRSSDGRCTLPCLRGTDSIRSFTDHEGYVRYAKANEAVFLGYRRVENLLTSGKTETFTTDTVTGIKGTEPYILSFTGTGSCQIQGSTSGNLGTLVGQGAAARVQKIVTSGAAVGATETFTLTVTGTCTQGQLENTNKQLVQVAGEYQSKGALSFPYKGCGVDGVNYYITANGNTVNAELITEAVGAAISSSVLWGLDIHPEEQELLLYTEDFSNAAWAKLNAPTITANALNLGGVRLSTLDQATSGALRGVLQTFSPSDTTAKGHTLMFAKGLVNPSTKSCGRLRDTTAGIDYLNYTIEWPGPGGTVTNTLSTGTVAESTTTITLSVAVPVGSTLLIACINYKSPTQRTVTGVTLGGSATGWTQLAGAAGWTGGGGDDGGCDIWYLISPASGTANVVATFDSAPTSRWIECSTWTGTDLTTPLSGVVSVANTGGTTSTLPAISLNTGDACIDALYSGNTGSVPTNGDTLIYSNRSGTSGNNGGAQYNNTDGVLNWTGCRNGVHYQVGARIAASAGTPGAGTTPVVTMTTGTKHTVDTLADGGFMLWAESAVLGNAANTHKFELYSATDAACTDTTRTGTLIVGAANITHSTHGYTHPVPYIPATSATVTRDYDQFADDTAFLSWFNNLGPGTVLIEAKYKISYSQAGYLCQFGGNGSERIMFNRRGIPTADTVQNYMRVTGAGAPDTVSSGLGIGTVANGVRTKFAYRWRLGVNGSYAKFTGGTGSYGLGNVQSIPDLSAFPWFGLGGSPTGGGTTDGNAAASFTRFDYYAEAKTDAQIDAMVA